MKTLNLEQGSPEWLAARAKMLTASEAPAMMGDNPHMTRAELLRQKFHGLSKDVSQFVQERVFDRGHRVEAEARHIAEEIIGDELYPATVCDDEGRLSASLDGMTMDGSIIWECKQWNAEKAEAVERDQDAPEADAWQVVQQLMVTGASKCLYMVTDGEREVHCWITRESASGAFPQLLEGWKQFEADLEAYEPSAEPAPQATGARPESLPSLNIQVTGAVLASNLDEYKAHALAVFEGISTDLQTDQDFADAEEAVKWCKEVEDRLKAAKDAALGQTESIDALFRTIDDISESARRKRLDLDKLVKARKEARRAEIQQQAVDGLAKHYEQINASLTNRITMTAPAGFRAEVGQAMKGKRTIQSLLDAADQALTDAKLAANAEADLIRANLASFAELAGDFTHLFADLRNLVGKQPEDFAAAIKLRISEHQADQQRKADAERKLAEQEAERKEREAQRQAEENEQARAAGQQPAHPDPEPTKFDDENAAPTADAGELMTLGKINEALAPITISAAGLAELGIEPHSTSGASKLYPASQFPVICHTIARHCSKLMAKHSSGQQGLAA